MKLSGLIAAAAAAAMLLSGCDDGSGSSSNGVDAHQAATDLGTKKLVEKTCKESVTNQLTSPSSAKFSDVNTTKVSDTSWTSSGTVDSQNGYGAMLRSTWTCTASYDEATETAHARATVVPG